MFNKQYDTAIAGGGIAAVLHACALAAQGRKVIILADSTSLMHEIGLSRLPLHTAAQLAARYPIVKEWIELLQAYDAIKDERIEPVFAQLLADVFVQSYGVDVLFEVIPLEIKRGDDEAGEIEGVVFASREGFQFIACKSIVDCTEQAILLRGLLNEKQLDSSSVATLWTLTCLELKRPISVEELTIYAANSRYEIQLSPSYWEGELNIAIAACSDNIENGKEIGFISDLEELIVQIREQAHCGVGSLIHVSERAWSTPSFLLEQKTDSPITIAKGARVASQDYSLVGIGCWTEAGHHYLNEISVSDKGGAALSFLIKGAMEAAEVSKR